MNFLNAPTKKQNDFYSVSDLNILAERSANILNKRQPPLINCNFEDPPSVAFEGDAENTTKVLITPIDLPYIRGNILYRGVLNITTDVKCRITIGELVTILWYEDFLTTGTITRTFSYPNVVLGSLVNFMMTVTCLESSGGTVSLNSLLIERTNRRED